MLIVIEISFEKLKLNVLRIHSFISMKKRIEILI